MTLVDQAMAEKPNGAGFDIRLLELVQADLEMARAELAERIRQDERFAYCSNRLLDADESPVAVAFMLAAETDAILAWYENDRDRFTGACTCRPVTIQGLCTIIAGEDDCPVHGFGPLADFNFLNDSLGYDEIAEAAGISVSTVRRLAKGKYPSKETTRKLSDAAWSLFKDQQESMEVG